MNKAFDIIGNILAVIGVLLCLLSGIVRLSGSYYLLGFETMTIFAGGTGVMVMASLAKLQQMKVISQR